MKEITNKYSLPDHYVKAVGFWQSQYTKGDSDFSVTGLLNPPQLEILRRKHRDEVQQDASDFIWSTRGHAWHELMTKYAEPEAITEERFYIEFAGWKVGGQVDYYHPGRAELLDYKTSSVYTIKNEERIDEWTKQLNMYASILRANGHQVKTIKIMLEMRDWRKAEYERDHQGWYPPSPVICFDLKVWPESDAFAFLKDRVDNRAKAEQEGAPPCTDLERWASPEKFAVYKTKTAARATRLLDTEQQAQAYIADKMNGKGIIQHRPKEFKRCQDYCEVAAFCPQFQKDLAEQKKHA